MKIAYFDCFSGISGDMILGALLDAGFGIKDLKRELAGLKLAVPFNLRKERVRRQGVAGTRFLVSFSSGKGTHRRHPRSFKDIDTLIRRSSLKPRVKELSREIFRRLAEAEGRVHRIKPEDVNFHELGALDSIIDIVGVAIAVEELGLERFYSSKLKVGRGFVESQHGKLPVPAPATLALLKGIDVEFTTIPYELITPTGAAILMTLCSSFGEVPAMKISRIGYGAGSRDLAGIPNLLRVLIAEATLPFEQDTITVIQTNIDDLLPVSYEYLFERLLQRGALDVYITPIQMKKSRPGVLFTVLCESHLKGTMASIIFDETTTFGLRFHEVDRYKLERKTKLVKTKHGSIRVKVGKSPEGIKTVSPEYEDCKKIASRFTLPLRKVYEEAKIAYRASQVADR